MKTKMIKRVLAVMGAAVLLAGCSTTNQGAMGDDTQYGGGSGVSAGVATGPNGSASRTNPFALNTGSGLTPAH